MSPALQWAQSPNKVFLDVKFAHRFDSPGCLEVQDTKVTFTDSRLTFTGLCMQSGHKIQYLLDFETFDTIDPSASTYSLASVGRLSINLEKKVEGVWSAPMKGKKSSNMQVWWEMKERYQKEMQRLQPDDEEARADRRNEL